MKITRLQWNAVRHLIALSIVVLLCISQPASAWEFNVNPISTYNYMDISTSNAGGYYVGFRCAGGGLNALHITTTTADPYGQVSTVSSDSGTFYLADTGGRGYFDRAILMVAVKVPEGESEISDDLKIHLKASGYAWTPVEIKDQPPEEANITYVTGSIDRDFGLSSVKYGPQTWKPAGEEAHSIMAGQSSTDEFYLFFVDTGVGILGGNSGITGLTDNGMAKIDYRIENYNGETIVFNVYGYALWADAVKDGIAWTNKIDGTTTDKNARTGASGYSVLLGSSGGSDEFGNSTAIDYGDGGSGSTGAVGWVPAVGNLNVTSVPAGAAVFLDSVDTGKTTNVTLVDVPEGTYTLRLERRGCAPLERTGISVKKGYLTSWSFNLTPAQGSCTVLADVRGARILIDGNETLRYANWTFDDIEVGEHTITLEKDGYDPVSHVVTVDETNATVVSFDLDGSEDSGGSETPIVTITTTVPAETAATTRVAAGPAEETGFFDYIVSLIAGLFGGGEQTYVQTATETPGPATTDTVTVAGTSAPVTETETPTADATPDTVRAARTGSVYVLSYPSGSSILIDGEDTGYTTPHLIYGIKAGLHTVAVKEHNKASISQKVVIPTGDGTVADFTQTNTNTPKVWVSVASRGFRGANFSVNGALPTIDLPSKVMVDAYGSYLTYNDGDHYYSETLPLLNGGESFALDREGDFGTIAVTSEPQGATVRLDGVLIGNLTPCTISNVEEGDHTLIITKPGYLPEKEAIFLAADESEIDLTKNVVLDGISTGRLVVTSTPSGCMVYLKGVYTGETTPCVFEAIPIGTYDVGVMLNRTEYQDKDVTVLAEDTSGDTTADFQLEK
ncbi:MAG: hypothetical protein PWP08_673 [Methanofollis sp.]|nr:hypothetical protein [Methanofollis sp.]